VPRIHTESFRLGFSVSQSAFPVHEFQTASANSVHQRAGDQRSLNLQRRRVSPGHVSAGHVSAGHDRAAKMNGDFSPFRNIAGKYIYHPPASPQILSLLQI
jgi:hypothetical protein